MQPNQQDHQADKQNQSVAKVKKLHGLSSVQGFLSAQNARSALSAKNFKTVKSSCHVSKHIKFYMCMANLHIRLDEPVPNLHTSQYACLTLLSNLYT